MWLGRRVHPALSKGVREGETVVRETNENETTRPVFDKDETGSLHILKVLRPLNNRFCGHLCDVKTVSHKTRTRPFEKEILYIFLIGNQ